MSTLETRIKDIIIQFNEQINSGYPIGDHKALLVNYLKKGLAGYYSWGFIGTIKKDHIQMALRENRLGYLSVDTNEVWMKERINNINVAISSLDLETLYEPCMKLGRFGVKTQKLVNSVKDFKFE